MKGAYRALLAAAVTVTAFLGWAMLHDSGAKAPWLTVEAPEHAYAGEMLSVRITLHDPPSEGWLMVDLHGATPKHAPLGFLRASTPQPLASTNRVFEFQLPVPAQTNLGYVQAVVFYGPSRRWPERTRAARTADLRVLTATAPNTPFQRHTLRAREDVPEPAAVEKDSRPVRFLSAGLWLVALILAAWRSRKTQGTSSDSRRPDPKYLMLMIGCLLAVFLEALSGQIGIGETLRGWTVERGLYFDRRPIQLAATAFALAGAVGTLLAVGQLRPRGLSLALMSVIVYAGLALTHFFSLHELDHQLALSWGGVSLLQLGQLATAILAALSLSLPLWNRSTPEPIT